MLKLKDLSCKSWKSAFDNLDLFLLDCDGVIWKKSSLIDNASSVINSLVAHGKMVKYVTNNSLQSRQSISMKLTNFGIRHNFEGAFHFLLMCDANYCPDIYTSGYAAVAYLFSLQAPQKAFVIGGSGITDELKYFGIPYVPGQLFNGIEMEITPGGKVYHDPSITAVIVGADVRLNYYKIQYAQLCLNQNKGCKFIATNDDRLAGSENHKWAEAGAMIGAIKGCTGREPTLVGKPSSFLVDHILERHPSVGRDRVCMVGDNLKTDILFGLNNGLQTVLTLSGVTSEQQLLSEENDIRPHYYCNSIADLFP